MEKLGENIVVFLLVGGVTLFIVKVVLQSRQGEKAGKEAGKRPSNKKEAGA